MTGQSVAHYDRNQITTAIQNSLDMLGAVAAPDVCVAPFPPIFGSIFHEISAALMRTTGEDYFAVGLPRGHGKTIVMKMMLAWAVLYTDRRFIAVVCASEDLAKNLIADVWDILQSDNMVQLFGAMEVEKDTEVLKKFTFKGRDIIIRAQGSGTSVRGLNIKMRRPDLFLMDDMQPKENAESETLAVQLQKWFLGTLLKAKAPERCTFIYLGNMYPDVRVRGGVERYTCILRNLQINRTWTSWIVGAILQDGKALWPEVRSLESLFTELENDMSMGEESTFYAEVLNDPNAKSNPIWDASRVTEPYSEVMLGEDPLGRFIILDPSLGKKKSDDQIGMLVEWWDDKPHIKEVRTFKCSAPETVRGLIRWMIDNRVPLLAAESVAYQATVIQWFDFMCAQEGVAGLQAVPVMPKGRQKNSRIISAMKAVMANHISVAYPVRVAMWLQAAQFMPTKTDNKDDIWDCAGYIEDVMFDYGTDTMILEGEYDVVDERVGDDYEEADYRMLDNSSNYIDFH